MVCFLADALIAGVIYTIERISHLNAKTHRFMVKEKETGKETEMSCYDYYKKKYNIGLELWYLPLLQATKKGTLFPMELAFMQPGQRYPYKLDETQV